MKKPTTKIISEADEDYGLFDQTARALEFSSLHVGGCMTMVGFDDDPNAGVSLEFAVVTDGKRGWLALVEVDIEEDGDWATITDELLEDLVEEFSEGKQAAPWRVHTVNIPGQPTRNGTLNLAKNTRAVIEAQFERCFAEHDTLAEPAFEVMEEVMRAAHYSFIGEEEIRQRMNGY